ncbi:hypothetical protein [Flavobacterium microcysteis]|uniref:Lipoprotein n=1 Tax=Flavobacterium microcysteis TaxID=2596891 RepID=A0A501Q2X3_9FLAO|nr:hypothetical protein [Flavobacterium microcysteis]TPD67230.1 hypothetical protein FJA49_13205 [Flavobacterium microcysteis]
MKKISLLLLAFSLFNFSCSSDDSGSTPVTPEPEVTDDFKFLSVTSEGKIFEIGNNTGHTESIGQITSQHNLLMLPTMCNIGSKIYTMEASAAEPNILVIYDKITKTTTTQQITLPASISSTMREPLIASLKYNGSELIAIVGENMPTNASSNKIISINLQNYQTTDLEIDIFQLSMTSTELINNNLYVSTREGLLEINLTTKTVRELQANGTQIAATRLAKISNTKLALMRFVPGVVNGVKPFEYNLTNNTLIEKEAGNVSSVGHPSGASVFHNGQYLNLIFTAGSKFGISKINYETNQAQFVELNHDIVGTNAIIVDILQ